MFSTLLPLNLPLRRKLVLMCLLTSALALFLASVSFVTYDQIAFKRDLVRNLSTTAGMIGFNTASALSFDDPRSATETLSSLKAQPQLVVARLYDKDGKLFATYQRDPAPNAVAAAPTPGVLATQFVDGHLELGQAILAGGETVGTIYLRADWHELSSRLRRYAAIVGLILVVSLLAAYGLAAQLQKVISGPVTRLAAVADRVAVEKDFRLRAVKQGDDEIGRLIDGFNRMLGQIQERDTALQAGREELEHRVVERTTELTESLSLLHATLESNTDGIVAVNLAGRVITSNSRFRALWGISSDVLASGEAATLRVAASRLVKEPAGFLHRANQLQATPEQQSFDMIEMRDGRVFERYVLPQNIGGRCVGTVINWRDITQRKLADESLRQSEEKFRQLADNITDVFWITSPDFRKILYISPGYESTWGRSREEAYAHPNQWSDAILPEDQSRVVEAFAALNVTPQVSVEFRIARPDGTIRWVHDRGFQVRDDAGAVIRLIGIASDITERKENEAALQRQQMEMRALFDLMPAMIWLKDTHNRILRVNQRVADSAGKRIEEIEGQPSDLIYPADAARFYADDLKVIHSGKPKLGIIESIRTGAKNELVVQTDKVPVSDREGKITGIVVMAQDITERTRAEESLRLLSSAVAQSKESIIITDAQLDQPGPRIVFVNPAFTRMTGYPAAEAIGQTPRILQGPKTDKAVLRRLRQTLSEEHEFVGEAINYRKDGREFFLEWQIAPVRNPQGQLTHFLALQRDITDRKNLEQERQEAHRQLLAISRQAGMAEVATGVLHNVGNVLNSVNVSATLVAEQVRSTKAVNVAKLATLLNEHRETVGEFMTKDPRGMMIPHYLTTLGESLATEHRGTLVELDHLRKNIEHIKEIVTMQQNYAKSSGFTEIVSLPDLIEDSLRINADSLARHHVELHRDYQARHTITTDRHKVIQILINLLRNSNYACNESGRTDKRIVVRTTANEHSVQIAVIDNGIGISPENFSRIFEHGFTTRQQGHGFGLHSAALAAKQLGGTLTSSSEGLGKGATFVLELRLTTGLKNHEPLHS